jgi:hypothetical protein
MARLLPELPGHERFKAVGRIAELVARDVRVLREIERAWVSVPASIEIEDWALMPRESA